RFQCSDTGSRADIDKGFAGAFRRYGLDLDSKTTAEAIDRLAGRPAQVRVEVATALDSWGWQVAHQMNNNARFRKVDAIATAIDPDPWCKELRTAIRNKDKAALRKLAASAAGHGGLTPRASSQLPARGLDMLCHALRQLGDLETALTTFRAALRQYPRDIMLNLGYAFTLRYLTRPRWDAIVRHVNAALALRPRSHALRCLLGRSLLEKGDLDQALAVLEEAALHREDPLVHRSIAQIYLKKGRLDDALAQLDRAGK